jgi:translocation and assembly module TamA
MMPASLARTALLAGLLSGHLFPAPPGGAVHVTVTGLAKPLLEQVNKALALPLPRGMDGPGAVDRGWVDRYAGLVPAKVQLALEPFGYYRPVIQVTRSGPAGERILVQVAPGEPVRIGHRRVQVTGAGSEDPILGALVAGFPLKPGDPLVHAAYEEGRGQLKSRAQGLGYLDADFSSHEIVVDPATQTASLDLVLATGGLYRFKAAHLLGAPDYPVPFLQRFVAFRPGDPFTRTRLGLTQLQLAGSERFKEVVLTAEPAADHEVTLRVDLKQGPTRFLRTGLGFGTDTGPRGTVRYRDLNMLNRGHELSTSLYVSKRLQGLSSIYTLPLASGLLDTTTVQVNLQKEELADLVTRLASVELARNRALGPGVLGTGFVRFLQEAYTSEGLYHRTRLVLPGVRYTRDQLDDPRLPTRGLRLALEARGTDRSLGSDTRMVQLLGAVSFLQPLPARLSLQTRLRVGATFSSDPVDALPPTLRFFAGGDQSVRGYGYQSLGDRDATGKVVGGRQLLTTSLELERALPRNWGVSLFHDAGNAFDSFKGVRLHQGAGVGLHYRSPVGSLNLSLARRIFDEHPGWRIHFTVGTFL